MTKPILNVVGYPLAGIGGHGWVTAFILDSFDSIGITYNFILDPLWVHDNPGWNPEPFSQTRQSAHFCNSDPSLPTLFLLNWGRVLALADEGLLNPLLSSRLNLCYGWWELDLAPDYVLKLSCYIDIILAPTRFIEEVARRTFPCTKTLYAPLPYKRIYKQSPHLRVTSWIDRANVLARISSNNLTRSFETVSLAVANFNSCIQRKNPHAAIAVFRSQLLANHLLIVKTANGVSHPEDFSKLADACSGMSNVLLIDADLSESDMSILLSCADVYISPHRAEGLGLTLLLADSAGLSSVITDYGGMLDYIPRGPGLHLRVAFNPVAVQSPIYEALIKPKSCSWADINSRDLLRGVMACIAYETHSSHDMLRQELVKLADGYQEPPSIADVVIRLLRVSARKPVLPLRPLKRLIRYTASKLIRGVNRSIQAKTSAFSLHSP